MAYTTPVAATVGQIVTAAFWNAEVFSQFAATFGNSPGTLIHERGGLELDVSASAKGSIYSKSAAATSSVLAVGANNTVLTADSTETTGMKWANSSSTVLKASNETVVSSTTLQDDNELLFTVEANKTYRVLAHLLGGIESGGGQQTKFKWSVPSGCLDWTEYHIGSVDAEIGNGGTFQGPLPGTDVAPRSFIFDATFIVSSTAGTVTLQWAQVGSEAYDHVIAAGSNMVIREVG